MTRVSHIYLKCLLAILCCFTTFAQSPPFFIRQPSDVVVAEGVSLRLDCGDVRASPLAQYRWLRGDKAVTAWADSPIFEVRSIRKEDADFYRCAARNDLGITLSHVIHITVSYLLPFSSNGTRFDVDVAQGDFLLLRPPPLEAAPLDSIRWEWTYYGNVINSNISHFVSRIGELVILDVQPFYAGQYAVRAFHATLNQQVVSLPYNVIVTEPSNRPVTTGGPTIVLPPRSITYLKDISGRVFLDQFVLECVGAGQPIRNVELSWHHNGTQITPDGATFQIESYNRRLVVRNPDPITHAGEYACKAQQSLVLSSDTQLATVTIFATPTMRNQPPVERIWDSTSSVQIACEFYNAPPSQARWYFNGDSLEDELKCCPELFQLVPASATLQINHVGDNSSGIYQCEPYNQAGTALTTTWLRTRNAPPSIMKPPADVTVTSGERATIKCTISGFPKPVISWKYNGNRFFVDGNQYASGDDGELIFPTALPAQSGRYSCVARNPSGEVEASAMLTVTEKAIVRIQDAPRDQRVLIGRSATFPCLLAASDGHLYSRTWYFKGFPVEANGRYQVLQDGSLLIQFVSPEIAGEYRCTITSSSGTQQHSAKLVVLEKPGMPQGVWARLVNDTAPARVEVAWREGFDGNTPIINYVLQTRFQGMQENIWSNWETSVDGIGKTERSVIVDNLKPSSNYEFRVLALNEFGVGKPSLSSNNITMPQQPPAASPKNVGASARSASSIMVQWQPPPTDQWNGDILGYMIRYRLADYANVPWIYVNISDPRAANFLIEDLITWREYELQAAAYNQRGAGVYSPSQYVTTAEGVPTEAPSFVNVTVLNGTAVRVEWVPPPQQQIPGVNLGYKVEAWIGEPGRGRLAKMVAVLPLSMRRIETLLGGLSSFTAYNVTVLCYTQPGDGPRSVPVDIVTEQDIPGPVKELYFDQVLFSSVKLVWIPPEQPNGVLANYTLAYWVSDRKEETTIVEAVDANLTTYTVEGLQPSTRYTFELWPSTFIGRGPSRTTSVESGVPPGSPDYWSKLPGAPGGLTLSNIQARSVHLQFRPGYDGKTLILRWVVEAQAGQSNSWTQVYNVSAPRAESITVQNLRPYTFYRLRLIALNVVGPSQPSDATERFQTAQTLPEHAPNDLSVEAESPTTLRVSWTPLKSTEWNGISKGYVLTYRKVARAASSLSEISSLNTAIPEAIHINNSNADEYLLSFLDEFAKYEVKMQAENVIGRSNYTQPLIAETYPDVPSAAPQNLQVSAVSSTQIKVTWAEVPESEQNGAILGYRVFYKAQSSYEHEGSVEVDSTRRSVDLTGLLKYTQYEVEAAAFTVMGDGRHSQPSLIVRTLPDLPGPPAEPYFTFVGPTELRLTWKTPLHSNGYVTYYEVSYRTNNTGVVAQTRKLGSDLRMFVATNLQPQTVYYFSISAENEVGKGQEAVLYAYTGASSVPPNTPTTPTESSTHAKSATQITLQVDHSFEQKQSPLRYLNLQVQEVNSNWFGYFEKIPGTMEEYVVQNLRPSTAYRFRWQAVNDFGESRWSSDSEWMKTLEAAPTAPPTEITAQPNDAESFKVMWKPPPRNTWNSEFVGYRVLFKEWLNATDKFKMEELPLGSSDASRSEFIIRGLKRFKHYLVQLQAFNRQGSSPGSRPVFVFVGYSLPKSTVSNVQLEVVSSTQIRVRWNLWALDDPINGFKVTYRQLDQTNAEMREEIGRARDDGVLLQDLQKYAPYRVSVRAFNKAGEGPPVEMDTRTSEDTPGPVGQLVFSDILYDSVRVSWAPPAEPNGVLRGYLVSYETAQIETGAKRTTSSQRIVCLQETVFCSTVDMSVLEFRGNQQMRTDVNFFLASGLLPNSTYIFSVKADTAMGYGPPVSGRVMLGPQPGSPEAPHKPRLVDPTETTVTLEWTNGLEGQAPITAYMIQAIRVGHRRKRAYYQDWELLARINSTVPRYILSFETTRAGSGIYQFRVLALNMFGVSYPSPASDDVNIPGTVIDERTLSDMPVAKPFYLQWWFLVILALVSLFLITFFVCVLFISGRNQKYKYQKKNSTQSLQLHDGGIVTYELRQSQRQPSHSAGSKDSLGRRRPNLYASHPPPRPDPKVGCVSEHAVAQQTTAKLPNLYDSLAREPPYMEEEARSDRDTSITDGSSESADDGPEEQDKDVSSIAQHYTVNNTYHETWQRAKSDAHRHSLASQNYSMENHSLAGSLGGMNMNVQYNAPGSRAPLPGFSSFV